VKLTILGDDPVPVHVDGEGWLQNPGFIMISHKNRAQMLTRDRVAFSCCFLFYFYLNIIVVVKLLVCCERGVMEKVKSCF